MKIPCCQDPTEKNISEAQRMIAEEYEKTGNEYVLIKNNGGKLEVVPKRSLDILKTLLPNTKVYDN